MATALSLLLSSLALAPSVVGQSSSSSFSYVQPLNTTILGPYGHVPPVYPSPNMTGAGGWEAALQKAKDFVAQLTIEEKATMVTGQAGPCVGNIVPIPRLGFPGLCLQDGPLSIRIASYASVFEAGVSAAATWNRSALYDRGKAMASEFRGKGAQILLGPVCGPLGRSGYAGRNWEGFAADPYLTGVAMGRTIEGIQATGVQATAKHFIAYEQETQRNPTFNSNVSMTSINQESVSSNVDDRTMHELYLWPFADAVKANVASVMCSYNRINGSYACENSKALNGLLKEELGFQGYVMSDWGGVHSGMSSIEGGLDMNMPGGLGQYGMQYFNASFWGGNITTAVSNGTLATTRLDDMIQRIMTPYYFLGQDVGFPTVDPSTATLIQSQFPYSLWQSEYNLTGESNRDVRADHATLIRDHGAQAAVLLKNVNKTLPLKAPRTMAIFGNDAGEDTQGFYNQDDFEFGVLSVGGGSGTGRLTYVSSPLAAIQERAVADGTSMQYYLNNTYILANYNTTNFKIPEEPDVCVVFLKTWAQEGNDRASLSVDWQGEEVVEAVASICSNTVVVTHSSGINALPFADNANVTALIAAHYPGQEAGHAIADILYGDVNPSGRLPYTIALDAADYNAPPTTAVNTTGPYDWQSWFDEKLEIDYRYFDANNISVRYEFGYGLSYTTFDVADFVAVALEPNVTARPPAMSAQPGGNPALWEVLYNVTVTVSNTGDVEGAAVPQLYLGFPDSTPAGTPPKQLRGFNKVNLAAGASATVGFELMRRDISYWDVNAQDWVIPAGDFTVYVGWSSRDLPVSGIIAPLAA